MKLPELLLGLQLGDSFFPSGASAHSYGLEGLQAAGQIRSAADVEQFLAAQLDERWACCDRVLLLYAHAAAGDLDRVAELDIFCDRSSWVESWRNAGRRLGRAQLTLHAELGTPLAAAYRARVEAEHAPGQASVVQGLIGAAAGLGPLHSAAIAAHALAVNIVGAALRLGLIGHIAAQRMLLRQRERSAALIERELPPLDDVGSWLPAAEIGSMAQEARRGRLFAS
jgi:urease accessory protein